MAKPKKELPFTKATAEELLAAQKRVSIPSMEHLKRWLLGTNRGYVIFRGQDLLSALDEIPGSGEIFQQVVNLYTSYRLTQPTGDKRTEYDPRQKKDVLVPIYKDDRLTYEEKDQCVRQLTRELFDENEDWKL